MEQRRFRFETKKEYEDALIEFMKFKGKTRTNEQKDYDELLEEYLMFCEENVK